MTRTGSSSLTWAKAALGVVALAGLAVACDEDGKSAPAACSDPPLEIFDIAAADPAEPGHQANPCVTPVGDAFSPPPQLGSGGGSPAAEGGSGGGDAGQPGAGGAAEAGAGGASAGAGGA